MARTFSTTTSDSLDNATTPITTVPLTMAGWFNHDVGDFDEYAILWVGNSGAVDQYWCIEVRGNTGTMSLRRRGTGGQEAIFTTDLWSTDGWWHGAGVFAANTDVAVYLNGGSKTASVTSIVPSGVDSLSVGRRGDSSPSSFWSGELAEVGLWNVALTDAEIAELATGVAPPAIRPEGLVAYWDLIRGIDDTVGGYHLTATGTTVSPHYAGMVYPMPPLLSYPVSGAPPPVEESIIPRIYHHRRIMGVT